MAATINGTNGNDIINLTVSKEFINALAGNDTVNGGVGDTVYGGAGDDVLTGSVLDGGQGADLMIGVADGTRTVYTVDSFFDTLQTTAVVAPTPEQGNVLYLAISGTPDSLGEIQYDVDQNIDYMEVTGNLSGVIITGAGQLAKFRGGDGGERLLLTNRKSLEIFMGGGDDGVSLYGNGNDTVDGGGRE